MSERTSRREMVVVLILLIAGAILALVATALPWGRVHLDGGGGLPVSGRAVAPDYQVLPLLALASVVGVVATRRVGRVLVGSAVAVAAVRAALSSRLLGNSLTDDVRDWAIEAGHDVLRVTGASAGMNWYLIACVVIFVAGGWIAVRGPGWPSMDRRYERTPQPPPAERLTSRETWDALDRGDDPTT